MSDPMTVGGRYELGEVLGRGGMAEVRRAIDTRLGRPVAVKQLRADLATDPTFQARFRREAQSAAGLNHPTIAAVYDTGEETDPVTGISIPYIVMELVHGATLRDVLRDGRKILPERALELTQGVLDALSYSHKAGIIHRDIKPANVMLTPTGGVKVMDFGIARAVADTSATMTQTAAVIGTAQYLSPEQARGETVDARSDIYSAGCLLYELLVGRPPFVGESPVSVAYQHVREMPVPPSHHDPVITPDIDAITLKALAKSADDRYQSAREMKADISRVLAGGQATAVVPRIIDPDPEPTRVAVPSVPAVAEEPDLDDELLDDEEEEPRKSRVGLAILITGLVVLLLGGGAFGLWRALRPDPTPPVAMVQVPNLITYNEAQVKEQLEGRGLVMAVVEEFGDEDTKDEVTDQDPISGTEVAEGSTVTVTINRGPQTGTIPDGLIGESREDVEKKLEAAGFNNVKAEAATSEDIKDEKDDVLSVSPEPGQEVSLGTEVKITYATGESEVPELTERTPSAAKSDATQAGFEVKVVKEETADETPGIVFRQSVQAGTRAARGTEITVTVAVAPEPEEPETSASPPPSSTPSPTPSTSASQSPSSSPSASATETPAVEPSNSASGG